MAPSPARHELARRELTHGGVIGVSVGMSVLAAFVILLSLPFILRARRNAKARRREAAVAEMGMAAAGVSTIASPTSARRLSVDHFAPPPPVSQDGGPRPVKEFDADGNSYEDSPVAAVQSNAVPTLVSPSPRHDVSGRTHAAILAEGTVRTESPGMMESASGAATEAAGPMPPPRGIPGRSESSRRRKGSKGSISQAVEELAGKASAVFRRMSTRSEQSGPLASPVRSPTWDLDETLAPAISAPQLLADEDPHTTGASAEYYSGLPMSPPQMDDYPQSPSPTTYGAPGSLSQGLATLTAVSTFAGVPLEPRRMDSGNTEFSPLSPVSPPIKLEHSFEDEEEAAVGPRYGYVEASSAKGEAEAYDGTHIKSEVSPPPPSKKALVPSPPLPDPGTVNPMSIWNPMNADERGHRVLAELHEIENSPPPAPAGSTRESTPAHAVDDAAYLNYHTPYSQGPYTPSPGPSGPGAPPIIREPSPVSDFAELDQDDEDFDMTDMTDMTVHSQSTPPPPSLYSGPSVENTPLTVFGSEYASASPASHYPSTPNPQSLPAAESPRTFECSECKRVFDQIHKLNHHKRYHERPHECPHPNCDRRFGTKTHLDRHINDKHNKTRKYHCTEAGCPWSRQGGKSFPRKDNWRRHMQNKHNCNPEHDPVEEVVEDQPMQAYVIGY